MMPTPPVTPFLLGLAVGPLIVKTAKPILRGAVKAVVVLGFEARKLAVQVGEEVQDIASETAAESITEDAVVVPPRVKR
jgi:hypothetical protein